MTTYTTIPNADIDQDSPGTQPLFTALRDNPIAIAEADSSVADALLPQVTLGTIATTSGTSQALGSLDLAPFKFLRIVLDAVGIVTGTNDFRINTNTIITSLNDLWYGEASVELSTGTMTSVAGQTVNTQVRAQPTSITNATTTITVSTAGATFNAGQVLVFGCK